VTPLQEVKKIISENLNVHSSLKEEKGSNHFLSGLQHFISHRPSTKALKLYELVLTSALSAEQSAPNAGIVMLQKFVGVSNKQLLRPVYKSDIVDGLQQYSFDKDVNELLLCALEYSASNTNIAIKKSTSKKQYVEIVDGYRFELKCQLPLEKTIAINNCKLVSIDGYVESVSEIHHLLERASDNKDAIVLACRGFSNDVLHTLKINLDRKTLLVYPYYSSFDAESANTLVDLAIIAGSDLVSSLRGDLISSINLDSYLKLEECILSSDGIRIRNRNSSTRAAKHVLELKKRIVERPELDSYLSKRIATLTAQCIDIGVPQDMFYYSKSLQLDMGIRYISAALNGRSSVEDAASTAYKSLLSLIDSLDIQTFT